MALDEVTEPISKIDVGKVDMQCVGATIWVDAPGGAECFGVYTAVVSTAVAG